MPTTQELKARVQAEIDRQGQQLIATTMKILNNPEPGFREVKTARTVAESFQSMGIPYEDGIGITGLKGMLRGGASGPTVAVMGELDSLKVLGHPHADPETTAAHACGHHCQIGMMLAVAAGLTGSGVMDDLAGRVALIAVPAEEYIEIEYRDDLRREGKLEFLGGKPEFIPARRARRRGPRDDDPHVQQPRRGQDRHRRHQQRHRRQAHPVQRARFTRRRGAPRGGERPERRDDRAETPSTPSARRTATTTRYAFTPLSPAAARR